MIHCWERKVDLRPCFTELVAQISSQLLLMADYVDFSGGGATDSSNNFHEQEDQVIQISTL